MDHVPVLVVAKGLPHPEAHQVLGYPLVDPPVRPLLRADVAPKELGRQRLRHQLPGLVLLVDDGGGVEKVGVEHGQGGVAANLGVQLVNKHLVAEESTVGHWSRKHCHSRMTRSIFPFNFVHLSLNLSLFLPYSLLFYHFHSFSPFSNPSTFVHISFSASQHFLIPFSTFFTLFHSLFSLLQPFPPDGPATCLYPWKGNCVPRMVSKYSKTS